MNDRTYTPRGKTVDILDRAWELVNSVPYQVSSRWVFYVLMQEGYYSGKGDYKNKWTKAVSSARKAHYKGWRQDTLADETRGQIERSGGSYDVVDWLDLLAGHITCTLDKWHSQPYYVQLWYEARAMTQQFKYYTEYVDLTPMGGHASIDYKFSIAQSIENAVERYQKPVVVLYFGDLDKAGQTISSVAERDIRDWCNVDFEFIHCGLTLEQAHRYNIPEDFEKPGNYQWEALSDDAAREIITTSLAPFVRHDAITEIKAEERRATTWLRAELATLANKWAEVSK